MIENYGAPTWSLTRSRLLRMTKDEIRATLHNRIYSAAIMFEALSDMGMIDGVGHEIATKMADLAAEEFDKQWTGVYQRKKGYLGRAESLFLGLTDSKFHDDSAPARNPGEPDETLPDIAIRFVILGSRGRNLRAEEVGFLDQLRNAYEIGEVVTAEESEASETIRKWAERHNIPVRIVYAQWWKYGKDAGKHRNKELLSLADGMVLFAGAWGSGELLRGAQDKGIPVFDSPCSQFGKITADVEAMADVYETMEAQDEDDDENEET